MGKGQVLQMGDGGGTLFIKLTFEHFYWIFPIEGATN